MDAIKILGSLLSNNAIGSRAGGSIIDTLRGGGGSRSQSGDILGTLLGGTRRSGSGGWGALGAVLAAAAAGKMAGGGTGGGRSGGGGLEMLGELLGGARSGDSGMLGSLLGGGGGAHQTGTRGGGVGDFLGGLLGGGGGNPSSGGGGLLDSLMGGGADGLSNAPGGAAGDGSRMLGLLMGSGEEQPPPLEAQEEAKILIEAMCNAAKADDKIDEHEREAILGRMGDLDEEEIEFLRRELSTPVNVEEFAARVPEDMDEQVYAFSLMAIKLDKREEAQYFAKLAEKLGLSGDTCNRIHSQLGQPEIFA